VGHYVSFVKKEVEGEEVMCYFNDENVWKTQSGKIG